MISSGRPLFEQDNPLEESGEETEGRVVEEKDEARDVSEVYRKKLLHSANYSDTPYLKNQADLFPDSVKVVEEKYHTFCVASPEDMDRYSEIRMEDRNRGKYHITSEEKLQWHEEKGSWQVIFRAQRRMFKTLKTTNQDPEND